MKHPLRLFQAFTVLLAGLYGLFIFAGNLMDYDSNFQFVRHVLSMDTTFEGNALMWRAIESPIVHHIAYVGIIIAEGAFAALGIIGGIQLFRRRDADLATWSRTRGWGYAAYALAFCIWFLGFLTIGAEWFAMWQSEVWNGKETAMGIVTVFAGFAVLLAANEPVIREEPALREQTAAEAPAHGSVRAR